MIASPRPGTSRAQGREPSAEQAQARPQTQTQTQPQPQAQEKAEDAGASGKLCAGRRLIPVRLRARRPRGELVGYLAGKLAGVPAD
jgi:hypothetical protein